MSAGRVMQCHYEVLGVPMEADSEVIRKAYRKAALEWHPDKNMHRIEEATLKFQLINDAHTVLSDPKERSWYDTHRESILRGGDGTFNSGSAENYAPNVYSYFTPQSKSTFYEYYSNAFEEINTAERADAERENRPDPGSMPLFGSKESAFAEVKRFYAMWEGFTSKMSFAWMDKYDTREAENRFQRRYVEKLNDSERSGARREYTDAVRSLVEYVKKRDERWTQGLVKQEQEEREKRERHERYEAERKAAKAAKKEALRKELEEEMAREDEERRKRAEEAGETIPDGEQNIDGEEEEETQHHIWSCGVCSKEFKSEKQLLNHEASKKHKDAVKAFLKKGGKLDETQKPATPPKPAPKVKAAIPEGFALCPSCGEAIPKKSEDCPKCEMPVFLDEDEQEDESPMNSGGEPVEQQKNGAVLQSKEPNTEDVAEDDDGSESDDDDDHLFMPSSQRRKQENVEEVEEEEPEPEPIVNDIDDDEDEDGEIDSLDQSRLNSSQPSQPSSGSATKKLGKAKQKRLEKEARNKAAASSTLPIVCEVCKEEFTSKTKLFKHVEDYDHAVPLDVVGKSNGKEPLGKGAKGSKKGKKKNG